MGSGYGEGAGLGPQSRPLLPAESSWGDSAACQALQAPTWHLANSCLHPALPELPQVPSCRVMAPPAIQLLPGEGSGSTRAR